jgi:hypothetical protein
MSWKKYGGINNLDNFNTITTNSIITNYLSIRQNYIGNFTVDGSIYIHNYLYVIKDISSNGNIYASGDIISKSNIYVSGTLFVNDLDISNNLIVVNKLYLGSSLSNYLYGNDTGIGVNKTNPICTFDISGSTQQVLNIQSHNITNTNVIASNVLSQGITVSASINTSSIQFFNNTPIQLNGISDAEISFQTNDDSLQISSYLIELFSNMSNHNTIDYQSNETVIIYDISNSVYKYDVFLNPTAYTGNALSLVACDNSSNTFMNIVTPNHMGLAIGGGVYINDENYSCGLIGLTDACSNYTNSMIIVKGVNNVKYPFTIGVNTHYPKLNEYVFDINGPVYINNCQITQICNPTFQIYNMIFNSNTELIVMGSPYQMITNNGDTTYSQMYYISHDGGNSWNSYIVSPDVIDPLVYYPLDAGFIVDISYCIFTMNQPYTVYASPYIYSSTNAGATILPLIYPSNITEIMYSFTSVYITEALYFNNSIQYVFMTGSNYNTDDDPIVIYTNQIFYFPMTDWTSNEITDSQFYSVPNISAILSMTAITENNSNILYLCLAGIGGIETIMLEYTNALYFNQVGDYFSVDNVIYNNIQSFGNLIIAVGSINGLAAIAYSNDRLFTFNQVSGISMYPPLNSVFIYDSSYAVAVGNNGTILLSFTGGVSWIQANSYTFNEGGSSLGLLNTEYNLINVCMPDINSMVITQVLNEFNNTIPPYTTGNSSVYYCYIPNIFNHNNVSIFDICGSAVISGNLNINNGGKIDSTNTKFHLLDTPTNIYLGNKSTNIYFGNDNSYSFVNVLNDLSVNNLAYFNSKQDVSYNTMLGALTIPHGGAFVHGNIYTYSNIFSDNYQSYNDINFGSYFYDHKQRKTINIGSQVGSKNSAAIYLGYNQGFNPNQGSGDLTIGGDVVYMGTLVQRQETIVANAALAYYINDLTTVIGETIVFIGGEQQNPVNATYGYSSEYNQSDGLIKISVDRINWNKHIDNISSNPLISFYDYGGFVFRAPTPSQSNQILIDPKTGQPKKEEDAEGNIVDSSDNVPSAWNPVYFNTNAMKIMNNDPSLNGIPFNGLHPQSQNAIMVLTYPTTNPNYLPDDGVSDCSYQVMVGSLDLSDIFLRDYYRSTATTQYVTTNVGIEQNLDVSGVVTIDNSNNIATTYNYMNSIGTGPFIVNGGGFFSGNIIIKPTISNKGVFVNYVDLYPLNTATSSSINKATFNLCNGNILTNVSSTRTLNIGYNGVTTINNQGQNTYNTINVINIANVIDTTVVNGVLQLPSYVMNTNNANNTIICGNDPSNNPFSFANKTIMLNNQTLLNSTSYGNYNGHSYSSGIILPGNTGNGIRIDGKIVLPAHDLSGYLFQVPQSGRVVKLDVLGSVPYTTAQFSAMSNKSGNTNYGLLTITNAPVAPSATNLGTDASYIITVGSVDISYVNLLPNQLTNRLVINSNYPADPSYVRYDANINDPYNFQAMPLNTQEIRSTVVVNSIHKYYGSSETALNPPYYTDSSNVNTGALQVQGGIGITQSVCIGNYLDVSGGIIINKPPKYGPYPGEPSGSTNYPSNVITGSTISGAKLDVSGAAMFTSIGIYTPVIPASNHVLEISGNVFQTPGTIRQW